MSKIVVPVVGSGDLRPLVEAFREDVRDEVGHLSGMKSLNKIPSLKLTFSSLKIGPETPQQGSWKLVFQASIFLCELLVLGEGQKSMTTLDDFFGSTLEEAAAWTSRPCFHPWVRGRPLRSWDAFRTRALEVC